MHLLVNDQLREHQVALVKDRIVVLVIYGLVHQRMWANKVEDRVGKAWRVVHTCSGTRLGNFRVENRQPGWVWCRLLLKLSCKTKKTVKYRRKKNFFPLVFHFRTFSFVTFTSELSFPFSILIEKTVNTLERLSCSNTGGSGGARRSNLLERKLLYLNNYFFFSRWRIFRAELCKKQKSLDSLRGTFSASFFSVFFFRRRWWRMVKKKGKHERGVKREKVP